MLLYLISIYIKFKIMKYNYNIRFYIISLLDNSIHYIIKT